MKTCFLQAISLILISGCLQFAGAQTLTMQIQADGPSSQNLNFRQADTFGFSVSYTPNIYNVYGNHVAFRLKWDSSNPTFMDDLFFPPNGQQGFCGSPNGSVLPPQDWERRCIDSLGYIWKYVNCPNGLAACASNDLWNGYPGTSNLQTFASPTSAPIWPRINAWGVLNFNYIINKDAINAVITSPPLTGNEQVCHPNNPSSFATGAANGKAVQVYYYNGSFRWFMAFNEQIHDSSAADTKAGHFAEDNWRILWATSSDGMTWTVSPQILFRGVSEANTSFCGAGLLVTDMFLDNGYFYMTFTDVGGDRVYMVRSPINGDPNAQIGYTAWSIAQPPSSGDPTHSYNWSAPLTLGIQQDFVALNAASIVPTQNSFGFGFGVKSAAITRVFQTSQPNSASQYIAVTNDVQNGCNPAPPNICPQILQLWSAPTLTEQLTYQSTIDTSSLVTGANGWEFGFTHYADNLPSSPRVIKSGLDFWVVQSLRNPNRSLTDYTSQTTITRKTATITP